MSKISGKLNIMEEIIEILINNQGSDGLSRITQNNIAIQIDRSPSCISKALRKLEKHDKCIEKVAPAIYKVNHEDLIKFGLLPKVKKYSDAIENDPKILEKTFREQSELINMSIEDIQMCQGYILGAGGKVEFIR